uniref:Fibronectin type-III domain-containing protein n=1 Tax=Stegastes partitus TaxID=144197 RepID=A0A3B4ZCN5_9TELE
RISVSTRNFNIVHLYFIYYYFLSVSSYLDIWMLPAPKKVSMDSVDMRHTLRWRPLQASCNTTVLYSVQYQGYFELLLRNGSWVDAAECQQIPETHCDLSFDLGSDSDYNLQVRAQCGSQLSAWTRLSQPFNRRDTVMTVPEMLVTTAGDTLQVTFDKLPPLAAVSVTLWKKDDETQVASLFPSDFCLMSPRSAFCSSMYALLSVYLPFTSFLLSPFL